MKYNVTFACGHDGRIDIVGPTKERDRKVAWYEQNRVCPACYAAEVERKKAEGCDKVTMSYRDYKTQRFWLKTEANSYSERNKTITVYIPETYAGLEEYIDKMASNRNGDDGLRANCQIIRDALDNNEITAEQSKVLVRAAKEIRYF